VAGGKLTEGSASEGLSWEAPRNGSYLGQRYHAVLLVEARFLTEDRLAKRGISGLPPGLVERREKDARGLPVTSKYTNKYTNPAETPSDGWKHRTGKNGLPKRFW
jgi:hypothetical protein